MSTTAVEADRRRQPVWVDQAAAARQRITETATGATQSAWLAFVGWYATAAVTQRAAAAAASSLSAQAMAAAALVQYVAQVTATLTGQRRVPAVAVEAPAVRNGAILTVVHAARPARVYRETFALTGDVDLATRRAADRAVELTETDIMLAARQAELAAMERLQVKRYRRVLRPELSESGPCGLCVVAADRIYTIGELMPLHGRCKCESCPWSPAPT